LNFAQNDGAASRGFPAATGARSEASGFGSAALLRDSAPHNASLLAPRDAPSAPRDAASLVRFWFAGGGRSAFQEQWFDKSSAWHVALRSDAATYRAAYADAKKRLGDAAPEELLDAMLRGAAAGVPPELACLGLILLLDQLPRALFSDARKYEAGDLAAKIARTAVLYGVDLKVPSQMRAFMYVPLLHSEDMADQDAALAMLEKLADERADALPFVKAALAHRKCVQLFGRLPERNVFLGRQSTPAELKWLLRHPTA